MRLINPPCWLAAGVYEMTFIKHLYKEHKTQSICSNKGIITMLSVFPELIPIKTLTVFVMEFDILEIKCTRENLEVQW